VTVKEVYISLLKDPTIKVVKLENTGKGSPQQRFKQEFSILQRKNSVLRREPEGGKTQTRITNYALDKEKVIQWGGERRSGMENEKGLIKKKSRILNNQISGVLEVGKHGTRKVDDRQRSTTGRGREANSPRGRGYSPKAGLARPLKRAKAKTNRGWTWVFRELTWQSRQNAREGSTG